MAFLDREGLQKVWAHMNSQIYKKAEKNKDELTQYLIDELAKRNQLAPEFANSVEECTDQSKLYVLPDGYIYAYTEMADGSFSWYSTGHALIPVDYEDRIVDLLMAKLGTKVLGRVDANNNIIILDANLPDGTYTLKYEMMDGSLITICTTTVGTTYANLFDPATAQINMRMKSNGVDIVACDGVLVTDYIDLGNAMASGGTNILHAQGFRFHVGKYENQFTYVHYYDANKTLLGKIENTTGTDTFDADGNPCFTLDAQYTTARYVRVTGYVSDTAIIQDDIEDVVITLNELIGA